MMRCDSHVHTRNSHDGKLSIAEITDLALSQGLCYLATTDHLDYDFAYGKNKAPLRWPDLDLDKYYAEWKTAKQALNSIKNCGLNLCFGIEAAYDSSTYVKQKYKETIAEYPFDVVINSVHCVDGFDVYFKSAFLFKSKERMYGRYLETVLESLDAPYPYDIVAHIGYITHGAPYKDKILRYSDFPDKIDAILCRIIEKKKCLEINFHHEMNPPVDIIKRYYDLGGRKISYGSDAHRGEICKKYDEICALLKEIGFTHFSVFEKHIENLVPIQ